MKKKNFLLFCTEISTMGVVTKSYLERHIPHMYFQKNFDGKQTNFFSTYLNLVCFRGKEKNLQIFTTPPHALNGRNRKSAANDVFTKSISFIWYIHVGVVGASQTRKNQRCALKAQIDVSFDPGITLLISHFVETYYHVY